jgi:hypothetical protein
MIRFSDRIYRVNHDNNIAVVLIAFSLFNIYLTLEHRYMILQHISMT